MDVGEPVSPELVNIRPHSGRATLITELMGEGMTTAMSMRFARHAPSSVSVHLAYGRLTLQDLKNACDELEPAKKKKSRWSKLSTKELLRMQKEVASELARRLK